MPSRTPARSAAVSISRGEWTGSGSPIDTQHKTHYIDVMQNDRQITVRVPQDLDDSITELAQELNLTRSEVIRNALTAGVLEGKQAARRLRNPAFRMLVRALLALEGDREQMELFEGVMASGAVPDAK